MAKRKAKKYGMPEGNVITMKNVYKSYAKGAPALNGISLKVKPGEFVFIVGDSGSGKSTLIKLLLRELTPTKGSINVLGYDLVTLPNRKIPKFRRNLGIVFQDFRLLKDRNIYENVAFAQRIIQVPSSVIKRSVPAILGTMGLADKYKNKPSQLSGGEQQRVALARALINEPLILLADEPTGNLDPHNSWEIMQLLEDVNRQGTTVVVVTHNREIVNAMHKRVITMKKGRIISDEIGGYTPEENGPFEEPEAVPAGEEGYSTAEMDGAYQEEDYNEDYGAGEYNGQDDAADSEEDAQKKTLRERFTEHFTGEMDALAEHYTEEYTDDFDTEGVPEQMMADIARMEQDATDFMDDDFSLTDELTLGESENR